MADINQPYQNHRKYETDDYDLSYYCNGFLTIIRKMLLFITICVGIYLYILSFIDLYNSYYGTEIIYKNSIFAVLITLFFPLWTKSFDEIKETFKDFNKIISFFLIFFFFFIFLCLIFSKTRKKNNILLIIFLLLCSGLLLSLLHFISNKKFRRFNNSGSCGDCDPFFCFPRYTIIECDCNCDCGDCGDCGECIVF